MKSTTVSLPCRAHSDLHAGIARWARSVLRGFSARPPTPPANRRGRFVRRGGDFRSNLPGGTAGGEPATMLRKAPGRAGKPGEPRRFLAGPVGCPGTASDRRPCWGMMMRLVYSPDIDNCTCFDHRQRSEADPVVALIGCATCRAAIVSKRSGCALR